MHQIIYANIIEDDGNSDIYNGISVTVRPDKSVIMDGTATEQTTFWILTDESIHPIMSVCEGTTLNNVLIKPFIGHPKFKKLSFDNAGERYFETGTDKCILFLIDGRNYRNGVTWNGIVSVSESSDGAEPTAIYADNRKYLNSVSDENIKLTVEAYTYPDEFNECIGKAEIMQGLFISQQRRRHFGFCYRTKYGNDTDGSDFGYKIHIVFDCLATPSDETHSTVSDSPEAMTYSWEFDTVPVNVSGRKPSSEMIFDSRILRNAGLFNVLKAIERRLYGSGTTSSSFVSPLQINGIFDTEMYIRDSGNNVITDSMGTNLRSRVFD